MGKFGFLKVFGGVVLFLFLITLPLIIVGLWYFGVIGFEATVIVLLVIAIYVAGDT
jgi:hypothetical protein